MKFDLVNLFKKHKVILILLISSFILFYLNINFQINSFGKYLYHSDGSSYHGIIKSPPEIKIWSKANEFKSDISIKNLQSYEFRHHFLPPKILGIMSKIFNIKFYDSQSNINIENINYFFIFQIIFYYFSVLIFYLKLIKINFNKPIIYISIFFLIFEPTINQYSSTVFGETIFFSLLILSFAFLIDLPKKNYKYLFFGLLLATLYLQRSVAIFLISVPVIILFLKFKKNSFVKISNLLIPFFLVLIILGLLNYNRSNIFYFLPTQTIDNLYNYFLPKVDSKIFNLSLNESKVKLSENKKSFVIKNNLDLSKENDRIKWYQLQRDWATKVLINNKLITLKEAAKSSIYSMLLNPVEILNTRIKGKDYYKSDLHKKYIKYRIFYSLIIFSIILIGFIYSIKKKYIEPHILLLVGIYFFVISGWVGYTRYFVPTLLSLCLYFGCGLVFLIKFIKAKRLKKLMSKILDLLFIFILFLIRFTRIFKKILKKCI